MTICKYFLQGNCRFGDRCRFEHTDPYESNAYENSGRQDYSHQNRSQASYSNYDDGRQYNNRYTQNQQYYPSERSYQEPRSNYNESYNQAEEPDYYANKYNRNKHTWVSEDYKKQTEQKTPNDRFFDTSTPKSKTTFSFKDTNVQSSRNLPNDSRINERNLIDAEIIKEDVLLWESGNQWPFTCYCPTTGKSTFPGFVDLSPEELRLEAYNARENNTYNLYVESVEKALQDIKMRRDQMKEPSVQLLTIIEKIRNGEDLSLENVVDGNAPSLAAFNQTALEDMLADESSSLPPQNTPASAFSFKSTTPSFLGSQAPPFGSQASPFGSQAATTTAASSFSFKPTQGTDEAPKSVSAASFSFKDPPESVGPKPNVQGVTHNDIYTPIGAISEQDKKQFLAPTFTLGKIPAVPPAHEMCF